jgi:DNA invertase Pin-like site-specific DNA recombinase
MRALGYTRVSTTEQADSRAGLEAQRQAIASECKRRGWELVDVIEDAGYSAKDMKRPGVQAALEVLRSGEASAIVVAKLDRLSRSMLDFSRIMNRAQQESWALVALDLAVDSSTPAGEAMAHMLATFAQFERRLIGQRTREALAQKKAQGVRLGRPRKVPAGVRNRIKRRRQKGATLSAIADELNRQKVPTAHGGARWHASTVRAVLTSGA